MMKNNLFVFLVLSLNVLAVVAIAALTGVRSGQATMTKSETIMPKRPEGYPVATFAGGCFWCLESEFRGVSGVLFTRVGYTGGTVDSPTYDQVSGKKSGHAEAVEVTYDPAQISYEELVRFFFKAHDPTQLNRQGVDVGPQYRSEIFYHDAEQENIARRVMQSLEDSQAFSKPIVTKLSPAETFWPAETYHQQYYEKYEETYGKPHIRVLLKHNRVHEE